MPKRKLSGNEKWSKLSCKVSGCDDTQRGTKIRTKRNITWKFEGSSMMSNALPLESLIKVKKLSAYAFEKLTNSIVDMRV